MRIVFVGAGGFFFALSWSDLRGWSYRSVGDVCDTDLLFS